MIYSDSRTIHNAFEAWHINNLNYRIMEPNLNENIVTNVRKLIISNEDQTKFISTYPKLKWTDNILFSYSFDSLTEIANFLDHQTVDDFLFCTEYYIIWSDTKEIVM